MEFKKILSGKSKAQILHLGFRSQWNRGPQGPERTTYFSCVEKNCKLDGNLKLKYHRHHQHVHRPDTSANIVAETMSTFRKEVEAKPDSSAKQLFENLSTQALESVSGTPNKLDLAKKLPTFRTGK